nr:hypothetical protein [Candidatus Brachybacter algidus]
MKGNHSIRRGKSSSGRRIENGFYIRPTINEGLVPETRTNQERFGPVATFTVILDKGRSVVFANASNMAWHQLLVTKY